METSLWFVGRFEATDKPTMKPHWCVLRFVPRNLFAQFRARDINSSVQVLGRFGTIQNLMWQMQRQLAGALIFVFGFDLLQAYFYTGTAPDSAGHVFFQHADLFAGVFVQIVSELDPFGLDCHL
jgi:hypothetical protein